MQTRPLLEVLYETEIPIDGDNRFIGSVLYTYEPQLLALYRDYAGASEITLVHGPDVPQVESKPLRGTVHLRRMAPA